MGRSNSDRIFPESSMPSVGPRSTMSMSTMSGRWARASLRADSAVPAEPVTT